MYISKCTRTCIALVDCQFGHSPSVQEVQVTDYLQICVALVSNDPNVLHFSGCICSAQLFVFHGKAM